MKKKSDWEYNKKKQEKRRIKKELKDSKKNTGSIELAEKQMEEFINKQKLKEESERKQNEKERSKELEQEESERKQKEILQRFNQDSNFRKQFLKVISYESNGAYGNVNFDSFESLEKYEKEWVLFLCETIEEKIKHLDDVKKLSKETTIPKSNKSTETISKNIHNEKSEKNKVIIDIGRLNYLKREKKTLQNEVMGGQDERNVSNDQKYVDEINEEIKKKEKRVESINREINDIKIGLRLECISRVKRPENLKNLTEFRFNSSKIILDSNAILDLSYRDNEKPIHKNKYQITHKIKSICDYNTVEIIIPSFVLDETKKLLENYKIKPLSENLVFNYLDSELNGLFGEKRKKEKFEQYIENKFITIIKNHHAKNPTEKKLSKVDAKCLLYAKHLNAVLVSNDQQLLNECKSKNVLCYNQIGSQGPKFDQTIISNHEEWFVGKIKRLKTFWMDIQKSKNKKIEYDDKMKLFKELFNILYNTDNKIGMYLDPICGTNDSTKNIKKFFDILPDTPDLTFDEIEAKIKQIIN